MTDITSGKTYIDARTLSLDEWLALLVKPPVNTAFICCEFPTDRHRDEYILRICEWCEGDVRTLLRKFLLPSTNLWKDDLSLYWLEQLHKSDPEKCQSLLQFTYYQRLVLHSKVDPSVVVWEGNTWVLDLLPYFPKQAIAGLDAYALAHAQWLPDSRFRGIFDAIEVIRAKYIGMPGTRPETIEFLFSLSSREFECLVERLYAEMGYTTRLTAPSKDGGRDIIARRSLPGSREDIRVECKHYRTKPVGVTVLRSLLGVVSDEKANKGVVVTTNQFTRGAMQLAQSNPRLEIISGEQLCLLLNEYLGPRWPLHIERLVTESERKSHR